MGYIDEDENTYLEIPLSNKTVIQMTTFLIQCQSQDEEKRLDDQRAFRERMMKEHPERFETPGWKKYREKTYGK